VRRLDRYVAVTVWAAILIVLFVIVGIDALSAFIDESDSRSETYGFAEIARYVALTLPGRCYEFIPFAALIGSLIGLGQLATTSELVVMKAAGVSGTRLAWVVLQQAVLLSVLGFALGEYVAPAAEQRAQSVRAVALYADRRQMPDRGVWRRDGRRFMHVSAVAPDERVYGVSVLEFSDEGWLQRFIFADSGRFDGRGWSLGDVAITDLRELPLRNDQQDALYIESNITPRILTLENVAPGQLSLRDLLDYTRFLRSQNEETASFELATWRKFLQPASVAALVLVAISFVFGPLRDGTLGFRIFAGVMTGVLFRLSQDLLGPASLVYGFSPLYAALAPIALCVLVGLYLLRRS
jgi:lipopolysaccharide export system permease protein